MDRLPPIPTPPSHIWRECRVRLFPALLFAAAVAGVILLWRDNVAAPTMLGEVEVIQSNVSSPKSGRLVQLNVTRFQRVKAGDLIGQVITTDPEVLESALAVIHAEIKLLRVNLEPLLGQQRLAVNYDRLRLDWMEQRVQLVTARVRLELAAAELVRAEELFRDRVVSQHILDTAQSAKKSLDAEVEERSRLVLEQERKLKMLGLAEEAPEIVTSPGAVMDASIKVQEEKLRLTEAELSPVKLIVQMDGTVNAVYHRSGEAILAGEPIVTVTAMHSDRIVGYMRQPLSVQPQVGMKVEVRTRSFNRGVSQGHIIEVGAQMEPISSALSPINNGSFHEVGLPVLVSLPRSQSLMPGEIVDLRILNGAPPLPSRHVTEVR